MPDRTFQRGNDTHANTLGEVIDRLRYKPGWAFWLADMERGTEHLAGSAGLTLCIATTVLDSTAQQSEPGAHLGNGAPTTRVEHWFEVPTASWDKPTWERWVLDCIVKVETHEALEFYAIECDDTGTLHKPFFPAHGPGRDPYLIEWKG